MNEPIICDGCDSEIELQSAYNCTTCRSPRMLRCRDCHREHVDFEHTRETEDRHEQQGT